MESIEHNHDDYDIKVINKGGSAKFKARIELTTDDPNVRRYKDFVGCWKKQNTEESEIYQDDCDYIQIATIIYDTRTFSSRYEMHMLDVNGRRESIHGQMWSPLMKNVHNDGTESQVTKPTYGIRVKIVAKPSLSAEFIREYKLDLENGLVPFTKLDWNRISCQT